MEKKDSAEKAYDTGPVHSPAIEAVRRILPLHIVVEWRGRCHKQDRR